MGKEPGVDKKYEQKEQKEQNEQKELKPLTINEVEQRKEILKKSGDLKFLDDIPRFLEPRVINVNEAKFETKSLSSAAIEDDKDEFSGDESVFHVKDRIDNGDCYFVKICEINHDDKKPPREVFENVLGALTNPAYNFVYMISGCESGVEIFFGIVKNYKNYGVFQKDKSGRNITVSEYGENVLEASLTGNFPGSRFKGKTSGRKSEKFNFLSESEMEEKIFQPIRKSKAVSLLTGIPSMNEKTGLEKADFQGIDRLINTMMGSTWQFIVICEPVKYEETQNLKQELYAIFDRLHLMSKLSIQMSTNAGNSVAATEGKSDSRSKGSSSGGSESDSDGGGKTQRQTGRQWGDNKGETKTDSQSASLTISSGESQSLTFEKIDKRINEILSYINDEYLDRIKLGETKGFFKTAAYALTLENAIHERLCRGIMSIFQGDRVSFRPLTANLLTGGAAEGEGCGDDNWRAARDKILLNFQTVNLPGGNVDERAATLYSTPLARAGRFEAATYMTAKEVSLIAGIPMKEVPGLSLIEGTEFGLNIDKTGGGVKLGSVIYRGRKLDGEEIFIDKNILNKHVFITGVTGSGKTTATQRLLMESQLPFFVVEPAKTEYRDLIGRFRDRKDEFVIFTLGDETCAPFRFNPFELVRGELITSHIDMLRAAFMSAFTMEAAMPQLIEEAIYNIYKNYGWNVSKNKNDHCDYSSGEDAPWRAGGIYWPKFSDLTAELKKVVKGYGFGDRLEAEYIGSLVSRLNNFTVGVKGQMFNCRSSVDFSRLLDKKVIFELEEIRTPEDKSLIMGLVLTRLMAAVRARYKKDKNGAVSHLIVIEEAHRLLSKYQFGDCAAKKDAVTMFADMLSEVRKYGEGIIIIDQIPNKLESDVLKNTNTKIVHRLFAQDDKEAVGATMAMDDGQKKFLSNLGVGEAVIFSESWNKPVHAKIEMASSGAGVDNSNSSLEEAWEPENIETVEQLIEEAGTKQLKDHSDILFPALERVSIFDGKKFAISGKNLKKYGEEIGELITEFNSLRAKIKSVVINNQVDQPMKINDNADARLMKEIKAFTAYYDKFIDGFKGDSEAGGAAGIKAIVSRMTGYDIIYERGPWIFEARERLAGLIKSESRGLIYRQINESGELIDCAAEIINEFIDKLRRAGSDNANNEAADELSKFLGPDNEDKRRIALKM